MLIFFYINIVNTIAAESSEQDDFVSSDVAFPESEIEELVNKANSMEVVADPKIPSTRSQIGSWSNRKGVILVTDDAFKGFVSTGHAGIIHQDGYVVEANLPGVQHLKTDWRMDKNQVYQVSVRATNLDQDAYAAEWCNNQVGKPYNLNFYRMDYRDKFYCSQLIRSAFLDIYGIDLDTSAFNSGSSLKAIHPMELVDNPNTALIYRMK